MYSYSVYLDSDKRCHDFIHSTASIKMVIVIDPSFCPGHHRKSQTYPMYGLGGLPKVRQGPPQAVSGPHGPRPPGQASGDLVFFFFLRIII